MSACLVISFPPSPPSLLLPSYWKARFRYSGLSPFLHFPPGFRFFVAG